jgi:hypothetical protein
VGARQKAVLEEEVRFWKIEVTLAVESVLALLVALLGQKYKY